MTVYIAKITSHILNAQKLRHYTCKTCTDVSAYIYISKVGVHMCVCVKERCYSTCSRDPNGNFNHLVISASESHGPLHVSKSEAQ